MKLFVAILTVLISLVNYSCNDSNKSESKLEMKSTEAEKLYRKTDKQLREIWEDIESKTNNEEWMKMDKIQLIRICKKGLADVPKIDYYCSCSLDYIEKKVPAEYIYAHSTTTLAFILGRASAQYCQ